jgi:hypothetical protein
LLTAVQVEANKREVALVTRDVVAQETDGAQLV